MFSTTQRQTDFLTGNCTDDCPCECTNASATSDGNAMTTENVAGLNITYNSGTQPHPILTFNAELFEPSVPAAYIKFSTEPNEGIGLQNTYFGTAVGWKTFSIQADAANLTSGRHYWLGSYGFYTNQDQLIEEHHVFGYQDVINHDVSQFGAGWQLTQLDRLVVDQDFHVGYDYNVQLYNTVSLITGENHASWFTVASESQDWTTYARELGDPHNFAELVRNNSTDEYILTDTDGSKRIFDSEGLLLSREDRLGNRESYTYVDDFLETITDVAGHVTFFKNEGGVVTEITDFYETYESPADPGVSQTTYLTYANGRLTKITEPDPDGDEGPLSSPITTYAYHDGGALDGLLKSIVDPRGLDTTIEYDFTRHVSRITERCGGEIEINSIPSGITVSSEFGYDRENLAVLADTTAENFWEITATETRTTFGREEIFTRNGNGHMTSRTEENGNVTHYTYQQQGQGDGDPAHFGVLTQVTQPDPDGDGPLGALTTTFTYRDQIPDEIADDWRLTNIHVTSATDLVDTDEVWEYGDSAQVTKHIDRAGNVTRYTLDGADNVASMRQLLGDDDEAPGIEEDDDLVTTYAYTTGDEEDEVPLGLIELIIDPNGNETFYTYYKSGLVKTVTYAKNDQDEKYTEEYQYDGRDRLWKMQDGRGNITQFYYDNLDRLITRIDPDPDEQSGEGHNAPVWSYFYDPSGDLTHITDPRGNVTQYVYDTRGRVLQTIEPIADPVAALNPEVVPPEEANINFETPGNWSSVARSGTDNGYVYVSSAAGEYIEYAFDDLDPDKKYAVEVRWTPSAAAYDKNALFEVFGDTGADPQNALRANLNREPQGPVDDEDLMWLSLGAFSAYEETLTIRLSDDDPLVNGGNLVIDAVRLVEVGPVTQTEFDCNSNLRKAIDPLGNVTEYEYDNLNRLTARTHADPDGDFPDYESPVTEYSYNAAGWLTKVVDPDSSVTLYQYDELGRPIKQTNIAESGLAGEYRDDEGQLLHRRIDESVDFSATPAFAGYDDLGEGFSATWNGVLWVENPEETLFSLESTDTTRLYIDDQLVVENTGTGSMTEENSWIWLGPGQHTIRVVFDDDCTGTDNGLIVRWNPYIGEIVVIPPDVLSSIQVTRTFYDADDRVTHVIDGVNKGTQYTYDEVDRLTSAAEVVYDPAGGTFTPTGAATDYVYEGNVVIVTNALDEETVYTYDPLYRLHTIEKDNGEITTYNYDKSDNLVELIDGAENSTSWIYDGLNRVESETIELDQVELTRSFQYDDNSNLIGKTDRNLRVTTYEYDNLNRRTGETWFTNEQDEQPDWEIAYSYDAAGNVRTTGDDNASYEYDYDALNRPKSTVQNIGRLDSAISFDRTFDVASRLATLSVAIGATLDYRNSYTYDILGRLSTVIQEQQVGGHAVSPKRVDFNFNEANQLMDLRRYASTTTDNNVADSAFTYSLDGQLSAIEHESNGFQERYDFTYDDANRLTGYSTLYDGIDVSYSYDGAGQLTAADYTGGGPVDESYAYDNNGNRTLVHNQVSEDWGWELVYGTGSWNRIQYDVNGAPILVYDAEGNLTQDVAFYDESFDRTVYVWDHRNRLVQVKKYDGNGTASATDDMLLTTVTNDYDAFNQLVRRVELDGQDTQQTVFIYDGGQVVLQFDKAGAGDLDDEHLSHRYLWGAAIDQFLADEQVTDLFDAEANETLWALTDRMGSVTDLVDSEGELRIHRVFDSYGNNVQDVHFDEDGDEVTSNQAGYLDAAFAFTGRWYDKATGLQNNLNRWYSPVLGRFISEDPIGFAAGDANLYRYVGNSPTNGTDPKGMWGIWDWWYGNGWFNQQGSELDKQRRDYWEKNPGDPFDQARNFRRNQLIGADTATGDIGELCDIYVNFVQQSTMCAGPIVCTGDNHHLISKGIHDELEKHPRLAGCYKSRDSRFVTRAIDKAAHNGYEEWHRLLDEEVRQWIRNHPGATKEEFERWLQWRYGQPDLKERFPIGVPR
jgi:RHS repeat-associated protein